MGRRRKHGDEVGTALLDAAEELLQEVGVEEVSIRSLAARVGTTTRAVYTVFGSKAGLLAALGARAYNLLGTGVAAVVETDDPAADLVEATVVVFRRFALEHPALFRLAVQRIAAPADVVTGFVPAAEAAWAHYERLVARISTNQRSKSVAGAAHAVHALCEGLSSVELRCAFDPDVGERLWREAMTSLIAGLQHHSTQR